jgi:hypothetical protein
MGRITPAEKKRPRGGEPRGRCPFPTSSAPRVAASGGLRGWRMPLRALRTSWEEDRSAESDEAEHGQKGQALILRLERHNLAEHR